MFTATQPGRNHNVGDYFTPEREDQERQKGDWEGDRDPGRGQRKAGAGASNRAASSVETLQ